MDLELIITSFPKLLSATVVTLKLLSASLFFGLFLGLFFAIIFCPYFIQIRLVRFLDVWTFWTFFPFFVLENVCFDVQKRLSICGFWDFYGTF